MRMTCGTADHQAAIAMSWKRKSPGGISSLSVPSRWAASTCFPSLTTSPVPCSYRFLGGNGTTLLQYSGLTQHGAATQSLQA